MNRFYRGPIGGYRPNPWRGFSWGSKHTTYIQNNFYGGGPRPMGFGGVFGFRNVNIGGCHHGGCGGGGSWMNWMLGLGMGTTFLGGILNMFGIGGGSNTQTAVIDDRTQGQTRSSSSSTTHTRETNISITNILEQIEQMNKKLDEIQDELNGDDTSVRGGDSDSDSDIDSDDDITGGGSRITGGDNDDDGDSDIDNDDDVTGGGRIRGRVGDSDNDSDIDNDDDVTGGDRTGRRDRVGGGELGFTLTPGARPTGDTVKTYDCQVIPGQTTWYEVARGMYTGPNGAQLTKDEIKAIYTALRAQYVDGGHIVNGQVYDKNNQLVDVSRMDLPKGSVKLPETITINGKTYSYNANGTVTPSNYNTNNPNITKAGAYSARQTSDNKWIATINGRDISSTKYDTRDGAINAAKEVIQELEADNAPVTE